MNTKNGSKYPQITQINADFGSCAVHICEINEHVGESHCFFMALSEFKEGNLRNLRIFNLLSLWFASVPLW